MARVKTEQKKIPISVKELKRQSFLMIVSFFMVVYGIIFYYWPLTGWIMAFQNYKPKKGLLGSKFVGLDKFKFLFEDDVFIKAIRNTFAMGLLNLVTTTIMAVLFAIILNEVRKVWLKKPIQTISYLPHFLSWIVVTGILHTALSSSGIVNDLLLRLGFVKQAINFFAYPKYFWGIVAFAHCWKETGWNAIIYLAAITAIDPCLYEAASIAAITAIDPCLYEAASIDGADRLQKIRYITLPGIKPTFMILLLMNVGNVLNAGFEVQYLLGNGLVQSVSQTIDIYVLKWGISQNDYSLGTAAGLFKSAVSILLIVIANAISKKYGEQRLF